MSYITLLSGGTHGGWAFGPRTDSTPVRVQPAGLPHVTMALCDPDTSDPRAIARATITLDAATSAAFTTATQPPLAERPLPAVLIASLPEHRLAVAIGVFIDTYTAHKWWANLRQHLTLPGTSIGVYPLIETTPPTEPG